MNKIPGTYDGCLDGIPGELSELSKMIKEMNKSNVTKETNMDCTMKKSYELPQWKKISDYYNSFINTLDFALMEAAEKKLKCLYVTKDAEYNGQIIGANMTIEYPSRQKRFVITIDTHSEIGNLKMEVFAHEINWANSGIMDKQNETLLLVNKNVNEYVSIP